MHLNNSNVDSAESLFEDADADADAFATCLSASSCLHAAMACETLTQLHANEMCRVHLLGLVPCSSAIL